MNCVRGIEEVFQYVSSPLGISNPELRGGTANTNLKQLSFDYVDENMQ